MATNTGKDARKGAEKPGELSRKRTEAIRYFFNFQWNNKNIVFAEAEKTVDKLGSAEVYFRRKNVVVRRRDGEFH